jgi:hypothetical protein
MAIADIQALMEDRLRDLVPGIDLAPGSRAQVDFIAPVIAKMGSDPFETDIETFIDDRFSQEFPEIFAGRPSLVRDTFSKPLRVMLEPFKRETQAIKLNQSLKNPSILSDDDADSIVANVFASRPTGGYAGGTARAYFQNPTNSQAEISNAFATSDGLNFFPTTPLSITAEEMVFQREGQLFYFDIPVRAEKVGSEYNIGPNALVSVTGMFGVTKVGNPRTFENGTDTLDTPSFVGQARQALTELSLVTRRGATARVNEDFSGQVRAVQVIGANDEEMQRDLLVATSPGHAWLIGTVAIYGYIAYVRCKVVDGNPTSDTVKPGDTLFFYLPASAYPGLLDTQRFVRVTVAEVLSGPNDDNAPYRISYFIRWSGAVPVTLPTAIQLDGGVAKKGTIQISSMPSIGQVTLSVGNGDVHVFGHSDVYIRPVLQPVSKALLNGLFDAGSIIERETLATNGAAGSNRNMITDAGIDFAALGVAPGDMVTIEQGNDAGTYVVAAVPASPTTLIYLTSNLTSSASGLRYRVMKRIRVDPFEPKIPHFPFGANLANDLSTVIGSKLLTLSTNDLLHYGAKVGDTVRILSGLDAGDYTVTAFDSTLGGRGLIVDRLMTSSNSGLSYEIFTTLDSLKLPLVRVKKVSLLDSAKQSTGITVPPAEPVAVVPTANFTSARMRASSQRKSGYVLPDLGPLYTSGLIPSVNVAASAGDRRYSLNIDAAQGFYRSMISADGYRAELDFRTDSKGACSYFLATAENSGDPTNLPPIDPKPGESLSIKSGPNKGSYLIKNVYKFKYHDASANLVQCYFLQIYGTFPVDPFGQLITFLQSAGGGAVPTAIAGTGDITFPGFFTNFLNNLGTNLDAALAIYTTTSPGPTALQSMILDQVQVDYEWGDPARGVLRTYFQEPTLFQQATGSGNGTVFNFTTPTGEVVKFRPDPNRYLKHELVPARLNGDADPLDYPRDLDSSVSGAATLTDTTRPSPYNIGIKAGDVVAVHEEIFLLGGTKANPLAVQTVAGSNVVTALAAAGNPFNIGMVGNLFFIEEGADKGAYRVVKYIDSRNIQLDRMLSVTTAAIMTQGSSASVNYDGFSDLVTVGVNINSYINQYLTLYGNTGWQGSFQITAVNVTGNSAKVYVNRAGAGHFPNVAVTGLYWCITSAPTTAPVVVGTTSELSALRPVRMYALVPHEFAVSGFPSNDPLAYTISIASGCTDGYKQPYRIWRPNVRRVTPTEMAANTDGPFCYFDTEVISLTPHDGANLDSGAYLTIEAGTYTSLGYRHVVDDKNLTYSMQESGWIDFPTRILPVGSVDQYDSFINIVGSPVLIEYEQSELVKQVQEFVDSPLDRVTVSHVLVRHFLPQYFSYENSYAGGSAPSRIAQDIIDYVNGLPIETPIEVSKLEKAIDDAGGDPTTPSKIQLLVHDWNRRQWLEMSQGKIGGTTTLVPYAGTPRVAYYVPGEDVSGENPLPSGERINLVRG